MPKLIDQSFGNFFSFVISLSILVLFSSCGETEDEESSGPSVSVVYMWVSSTTTNGDIDYGGDSGVAGADNICMNNASGISLPSGDYTHRAVLASPSFHPKNIFSNDPPIQRPNGTIIANKYSNFFKSSVTVTNTVGVSGTYWTGINDSGNIGSTCTNWTTNSGGGTLFGGYGNGSQRDIRRLGVALYGSVCSAVDRILCISY